MNKETVSAAVHEAREFIKRAKAWTDRTEPSWSPSREGGDLRRQSMELTRALVKMRKS